MADDDKKGDEDKKPDKPEKPKAPADWHGVKGDIKPRETR